MITYNAELVGAPENMSLIMDLMEEYRIVVNKASRLQFDKQLNSITKLHNGAPFARIYAPGEHIIGWLGE